MKPIPTTTISVTPILHPAYVLLMIFIFMTTASVHGPKIDLPKLSNKPSTDHKEVRIVQIQADGSRLPDDPAINMPELESKLNAARDRDQDMLVVIQGGPQVYYSPVDIIDMAGRLNISNVGLVTSRIGT
ncbi:MAG: biopolymer transporter ExbD [Gallionellaceae bacterium]